MYELERIFGDEEHKQLKEKVFVANYSLMNIYTSEAWIQKMLIK